MWPWRSWREGALVQGDREALLKGRIDLAVHSMKDVPTQLPDLFAIAAITERKTEGRDDFLS